MKYVSSSLISIIVCLISGAGIIGSAVYLDYVAQDDLIERVILQ